MVKYTKYESYVSQIHRMYCKSTGIPKKEKRAIPLKESLLALKDVIFAGGLGGRTYLAEWCWLLSNKTMIFVKDNETCESIFKGKYEISYIDGITPPSKNFILNFPASYRVEGFKMPSLSVCVYTSGKYKEEVFDPVMSHANLNEEFISDDGEHYTGLMLEVFFALFSEEDGKWARHRFFSPWNLLGRFLETENPGLFKNQGDRDLTDITEATEKEQRLTFLAMKFVVSFMVYCQATNGKCLIDGLPGNSIGNKELEKAFNTKDITKLTLQKANDTPEAESEKDQHYRSWHIRQLRDERYYQNSHKDSPRGSRLVFVKDSIINGDGIAAKTAIKAK